jgi:hypothetical protein
MRDVYMLDLELDVLVRRREERDAGLARIAERGRRRPTK